MWLGKRKITQEEKSNKQWKSEFNDYYAWKIRHCKKADHTVRVVGSKQIDAENRLFVICCGYDKELSKSL